MDKYNSLIEKIRKSEVNPDRVRLLEERILDMTINKKVEKGRFSPSTLIFGWAEYTWLRSFMIAASVVIISIFGFQQFVIARRLGNLEDRMVNISTASILRYQVENSGSRVFATEFNDKLLKNDSVTVSRRDLMGLIKSYRDLEKKYNELNQGSSHDIKNGKDGIRN